MRYEFRRWLDTTNSKNLVFIDEKGVNLARTRNYGRCQGGARVYDNRPGNKGKNITLMGAMSEVGLIATMTFPGSLNTASFLVFVEKWKCYFYVTDGWKVYPHFIPDGDQIISKTYMTRVEGENTRLRHYLARLKRKTLCYSCI